MSENPLTFGSEKTFAETGQGRLEARIGNAVHYYMCGKLGRSQQEADRRTQLELERGLARETLDMLAAYGLTVEGKRVLDIGAGMGAMTTEIACRGAAAVMGIEPDAAWRLLARDRVSEVSVSPAHIVAALGEQIPFRGASFDLVVSLKVLEHCADAPGVIREAWRVLRPGGIFYFNTENYLSFWEPHYNVPWLPLLPKKLGALYLRLRGRSPDFLYNAIHYTTLYSVRRAWKAAGFVSCRDERIECVIAGAPPGMLTWKKRLLRAVAGILPATRVARMAVAAATLSRVFRIELDDTLRKPET